MVDLENAQELAEQLQATPYHDRNARAVWFAMVTIYFRCFAGGPRQLHIRADDAFPDAGDREKHDQIRNIRDEMNHPGYGWSDAYPTVTVRDAPGEPRTIVGNPQMGARMIAHSAARDAPLILELCPKALAFVNAKLDEELARLQPGIAALSQQEIDRLDMEPLAEFPALPKKPTKAREPEAKAGEPEA